MNVSRSCVCQSSNRAWTIWGFISMLCLSPIIGKSTSSDPYNIEDHPELEHLDIRLKGIVDKHKEEFSHVSDFFDYVEQGAGICVVLFSIIFGFLSLFFIAALFDFFELLYEGAHPALDPSLPIKILGSGALMLFFGWLVGDSYVNYVNPGGLFLTNKGILFVKPGTGVGEWIPYGHIKNFVLNGNIFYLEVVKDFDFCYVRDLVPVTKPKSVKVMVKDMGGAPLFLQFYMHFKERFVAWRIKLMIEKKKYAIAKARAGNNEAGAEKHLMIPASLLSKVEAILAEEREEGGDPLFQRIDHYAPYKPFAFDYFIFPIMLLGYSIIAWLLRDYNESYSGLVWLGAIVLGLASIFFAKQSYDNYSKSRNLGGWLLTDTGMLLIEPGAKIAYKFVPYGPMLSFLWDGTGEKEIFMLSEASPFDKIKASDMASEEVFDDFVRNLQYKQIDAEEL